MYDVYEGINREEGGGVGVAIGKLRHPNILPTNITIKMSGAEFL